MFQESEWKLLPVEEIKWKLLPVTVKEMKTFTCSREAKMYCLKPLPNEHK